MVRSEAVWFALMAASYWLEPTVSVVLNLSTRFSFLAFSLILFSLLCLPVTFVSFNTGNLPKLRQVTVISDNITKM